MGNIYKEGINRNQQLLLPPSMDEYVSEENVVRVIDAYVEILDLPALGFTNAALGSASGQPAYHPKVLLKMYIYGYLNRVRSSRALEKENNRNIELMWLTQGLKPSYKTIANFRKDNPKALRSVFKEFVSLSHDLKLIQGEYIAIDGAFLRANASKNQLITKEGTEEKLNRIEKKIQEYFDDLDQRDVEESTADRSPITAPSIDALKKLQKEYQDDLKQIENHDKKYYCKSDPDASVMKKPAHNVVAYNAQIAVDDAHKLIVATDVSTKGVDFNELSNMAKQSKVALNQEELTVVADAGYYSKHEIKACRDENITPIVPIPDKEHQQKVNGKYIRSAFVYDQEKDAYLCPASQWLTKSTTIQHKNNKLSYQYRLSSPICKACSLKSQCLPEKTPYKRIFRWEHESVIDEHRARMQTEEARVLIKRRGSIVEHPFGTIKRRLGWDHYLVRGKEKVLGETSLIMFTYNFSRVLKILGYELFIRVIKAIQSGTLDTLREEIEAYIRQSYLIIEYFSNNNYISSYLEKNLKLSGK